VPIYEYRRPDGTTFELVQAFSDDALSVDPETGVPVERVLHPPAVHFKGKGFYNTDYGTRKRQRENAAGAEGGAPAKDSAPDAAKGGSGESRGSGESGSDSTAAKGGSSSKEGAKGEAGKGSKDAGAKGSKPSRAR
jgi:predicted nucleic acid-binding Zn ribbon protein